MEGMLEVAGAAVVGLAAFVVTQVVVVAPLDSSLSRDVNSALFCTIPVAVYALYRIYFGVSLYIPKLLPAKLKSFGEC